MKNSLVLLLTVLVASSASYPQQAPGSYYAVSGYPSFFPATATPADLTTLSSARAAGALYPSALSSPASSTEPGTSATFYPAPQYVMPSAVPATAPARAAYPFAPAISSGPMFYPGLTGATPSRTDDLSAGVVMYSPAPSLSGLSSLNPEVLTNPSATSNFIITPASVTTTGLPTTPGSVRLLAIPGSDFCSSAKAAGYTPLVTILAPTADLYNNVAETPVKTFSPSPTNNFVPSASSVPNVAAAAPPTSVVTPFEATNVKSTGFSNSPLSSSISPAVAPHINHASVSDPEARSGRSAADRIKSEPSKESSNPASASKHGTADASVLGSSSIASPKPAGGDPLPTSRVEAHSDDSATSVLTKDKSAKDTSVLDKAPAHASSQKLDAPSPLKNV